MGDDTADEGDDQLPPGSQTAFWRGVERAFSAVLEAGAAARTAALASHCGADPALRAEVEALLEADARAGAFLEPPGADPLAEAAGSSAAADSDVPVQVGTFRLLERLGEGGMGAVFRAERAQGDFRQEVAVKLIAARLYGADTLRRFRSERQILASLQHPGIVALLDGGLTTAGHPYIVMEHVRGVSLTEHCRRERLPLADRLRLFRQLCAAVGFAHRHLVVHRDLKPANVLVTAEGTVKVLDFGVAKLLEREGGAAQATATALGPLTPDYASPEQITGAPVTTACDVYALGVMLYELVSGRRPYATAGLALDELLSLVLHEEPPRPSAAPGGGVPYDLRRLRGDLDAVVQKAMSKDPERRYASAEELSEELQRFVDGRPVTARAPSLRYVAGRFVARHRAAVSVAGVLLVLLLTAFSGALWQARVSERERQRAERQFRAGRELANTLLFEIHDLVKPLPGATRAREALVAGALKHLARLSAERGGDRDLAREMASAYERIAELQGNLVAPASRGDVEGARQSLLQALAMREEILAEGSGSLEDRLALSEVRGRLATWAANQLRHDESRRWAGSSLQALEAITSAERGVLLARGRAHARLCVACTSLGETACADEAEAAALRAYRELVERHPRDADVLGQLARVVRLRGTRLLAGGAPPEAAACLREAVALYERVVALDPEDFPAAHDLELAHWFLGDALRDLGEVGEAVREHRRVVAFMERSAAADEANFNLVMSLAGARAELAQSLVRAGRVGEALRTQEAAVRCLAAHSRRSPAVQAYLAELKDVADQLARLATAGGGEAP